MVATNMAVCVSFLLWVLCLSTLCNGAGSESVGKGSEIDKDEMGMAVLYDMVHTFLGDVIHKEKISDSFLNLSTVFVDGKFEQSTFDDWKSWLDYLSGFAVCIVLGAIYFVFMPVTGLIFCCCRLCGKCGARRKVRESKRAKCKRRTYCTLLVVFNTVTLAGVVCAFVCNNLIYKHLQNDNDEGVIGHIKSGLNTFGTFMNDSVQEASDFINTEYDQTSAKVLTQVNVSAMNAVDSVLNELNATAYIDETKLVAQEANRTKDALDEISASLTTLQSDSSTLQQNLTEIRNSISSVCSKNPNQCLHFDVADYNTDANFSSLDELTAQASEVAKALDMNRYIVQAEEQMESAKKNAREDVGTQIHEAETAVEKLRDTVNEKLQELENFKSDAIEFIPNTNDELDDANEKMRNYSKYVFYGGIGICCSYLLIVVLYYLGVLYGLCGEKPGDDAPCCHTGVGANFLMAGVAFTFIFSWLLMMLCVLLFALGGPAYTEVCRYFVDHDPQEVRFLDDALKNGFDFKSWYEDFPKDFSISNSLQQCQNNASLYTALHLDSVVNLDQMMDIKDLETRLDDLKKQSFTVDNITILSSDLEQDLRDFANSGLDSVDFSVYFEQLNKELTKGDLEVLAVRVSEYAKAFNEPDSITLEENAKRLQNLTNEDLPAMRRHVGTLNSSLSELQSSNTLRAKVNALIDDLGEAEKNFNENKNYLIKAEIAKLADSILDTANASLNRIKKMVRTDLVKCGALTNVVYTLTDSACVLGLDPVNGLWFSFGWCLFFFIPSLIFAVLLASQYRREQEYEKDFDEPNYQMYGGHGHSNDTIPLTSVEHPRSRHSGADYPPNPAPRQAGQTNSAYSPEGKGRGSQYSPPPYDEHLQHPGIAAYAVAPPYAEMGHQHHDLSSAYPALHASAPSHKNSFSYPY